MKAKSNHTRHKIYVKTQNGKNNGEREGFYYLQQQVQKYNRKTQKPLGE